MQHIEIARKIEAAYYVAQLYAGHWYICPLNDYRRSAFQVIGINTPISNTQREARAKLTHLAHCAAAQHRAKILGRLDYEADVARRPRYNDGTYRKTWFDLGKIEQDSWIRAYSN